MKPGFSGGEEEADLRKLEFWDLGVGEGDVGDVEIEAARVGESEFVEGDGEAVVGSDLGDPDFGGGGGCEEEDEDGEEEERRSKRRHFGMLNCWMFE